MAAMLLLPNTKISFCQEGTPFSKDGNFALTSKSALNRDHTRTYEHLYSNKDTINIKAERSNVSFE